MPNRLDNYLNIMLQANCKTIVLAGQRVHYREIVVKLCNSSAGEYVNTSLGWKWAV